MWVSPFARGELDSVLERAGATARTARAVDVDPAPTEAWDLDDLRAEYDGWLANAGSLVAEHLEEHGDDDEAAFAGRFHLVHEWRKFLFADPGPARGAAAAGLAGPGRSGAVPERGDRPGSGRRPVRGPLPGRRLTRC